MRKIIPLCMLLLPMTTIAGPEMKDARTRDEDISATAVSVDVMLLDSGFYDYVYTLTTPLTNLGTISEFSVDIACATAAESVAFPEPPTTYPWDYRSADRRHAPLQPYPSPTGAAWMTIGTRNRLVFPMTMEPGESHTGFRILSPYPPADRGYELRINWTVGDYNYPSLTEEELDRAPVRDDFWVNGMTKGPGCSRLPAPAALFEGTRDEPDDDVLRFATPARSAFHTQDATVDLDVYYAADLDPESFDVKPESLMPFFAPVPGTHQIVTLKLSPGVNRISLYAERARDETADMPPGPAPFDVDTFMIRRDEPSRGGAAK